jgi:bifunctional N-acetylglucosamine-1-phosphate-uridyltransferase/glucosamine-1-phosphate-acetyltransferase GlmU-like protein
MNETKTNLVFVGGGGLALEVYTFMLDQDFFNINGLTVKGVLNAYANCELLAQYPELPYLGLIEDYVSGPNDKAIIMLGGASDRARIAGVLSRLQLPLFSYIHPSAIISSTAVIADGCYIAPHCVISANAVLEANVLLNVYSAVGHGSKVGAHSVMSPYSVVNGNCILGETVYLGTRVALFPKTTIEKYSLIDAGCIIRENIPAFSIVSQRPVQQIIENRVLKRACDPP